jgi:2-hydroxy-6-oxonona-2,4-dienedioate hydrolase
MNTLRRRYGFLIAITLFGAIASWAFVAYRADLRHAIQRVSSGSVLAFISCGEIEYAVVGHGPPVLVIHGAGGGFDQGVLLGRELAARGYRAIAVSRFGYWRTPMPPDASPETQADAHACLLQLALEALEHDFAYWLLMRFFPRLVTSTLLATPPELLDTASRGERERIQTLREQILPVSRRVAGLRMDGSAGATLRPYELERIEARTLSISLEDDLFETYPGAQYSASRIPGARLVGFPSGGHVWVGHHSEIIAAIADFRTSPLPLGMHLNRNGPSSTATHRQPPILRTGSSRARPASSS